MAVVSKPSPLASPRFTKWYNARGLRSFMGAPHSDGRSVFLSTFGKKINLNSSKTLFFFFGLQLHLARIKCSKIQEVLHGAPRNVNAALKKLSGSFQVFNFDLPQARMHAAFAYKRFQFD